MFGHWLACLLLRAPPSRQPEQWWSQPQQLQRWWWQQGQRCVQRAVSRATRAHAAAMPKGWDDAGARLEAGQLALLT